MQDAVATRLALAIGILAGVILFATLLLVDNFMPRAMVIQFGTSDRTFEMEPLLVKGFLAGASGLMTAELLMLLNRHRKVEEEERRLL